MTRSVRGAGGLVRRIAVTVLGGLLVVVGVVLLVLPGPGLLLVLAGLVVLANEYPWARRWTGPVRTRAVAAARASVATRLRIAWAAGVGVVLLVAGLVWGLSSSLPFHGWPTGSSLMLSGIALEALLVYSIRHYRGVGSGRTSRRVR